MLTSSVTARRNTPRETSAGEIRRNQQLRWVDWRFLLPDPVPRTVARFIPVASPTAAGIGLVAQRVVDGWQDDVGESCDVALCGSPDQETLRAAARALVPGGALHLAAFTRSPSWLRDTFVKMESAGLLPLGAWIPFPASGKVPRAWVPAGGPATFDFPRGQVAGGGTLRSQISARARAGLWRLRLRGLLPSRVSILAIKPGGRNATAASDRRSRASAGAVPQPNQSDLLSAIRLEWHRIEPSEIAEPIRLALLTPGREVVNKVIGLAFRDASRTPCLVVKMPRVAASVEPLRNEVEVLRALDSRCDLQIRGIPRILFEGWQGSMPLVGETFVDGTPLSSILGPRSAERLAHMATDWLISLSRLPPLEGPSVSLLELAHATVREFTANFGRAVADEERRAVERLLPALEPLPVTVEQRDFSPWNLRVDGAGKLAVLDWESAVLDGFPLLDLLYFLTYVSIALDRARSLDEQRMSLRRLAEATTLAGRIASDCVDRYVELTGIPRDAVPALRAILWMVHANAEVNRQRRISDGVHPEAPVRRSRFLPYWREELRLIRGLALHP